MTTTTNLQGRVQLLVLRALEASIALGRRIDPDDVCHGDHRVEPYYAIQNPLGLEFVVEGDYARGTVRVRDLDGKVGVEVSALAPLPLSLEALLAYGRAAEAAARHTSGGSDDRAVPPNTSPAPLSAF